MPESLTAIKIGVIGLGYVGIVVAEKFSSFFSVIGFDIDENKVHTFQKNSRFKNIDFYTNPQCLEQVNFYIVTVPTPVDKDNLPELSYLEDASRTIGRSLERGDVVVYESTVYPGTTEEICIPLLEEYSGLKAKIDFYVGYSPERVSIGDEEHSLESTKKIISAQTTDELQKIRSVYSQVIDKENIFCTDSIKIAEAAKILENAQRDTLIALTNQVSFLFNQLSIDIHKVIEAAGTKWNFNPVTPGLVGGHCISVDPYYLAYLAKKQGIRLTLVEEARRINESVPNYIAQVVQELSKKRNKILLLGCTYKKNTNDIRNSKSLVLIEELKNAGHEVHICDYLANPKVLQEEHNITLSDKINWKEKFDVVILSVAHAKYVTLVNQKLDSILNEAGVLIDIEGAIEEAIAEKSKFIYWKM